MRNFLIGLVTSALALALTALVLPGVAVQPYDQTTLATVLSYMVVALVFGLVNGIIAPLVKFATACLYVLTLGLFGLIVNGLMFLLVGWISMTFLGWGLIVDGFWWAVAGALVMSIANALIGVFTGVLRKQERFD
ncbi:phage holin family protein [Naumannella halotolerans]|uniref:Putative membrane protein n=1 Tax=Naumannella halotolerans TaxID=993414 RepID=A0A4R7J161_9ACTN|nr:phage holin family protein [Naumannella halotolerans]TDT30872.1 putative membrane protein [Naumannella halotolerans]